MAAYGTIPDLISSSVNLDIDKGKHLLYWLFLRFYTDLDIYTKVY